MDDPSLSFVSQKVIRGMRPYIEDREKRSKEILDFIDAVFGSLSTTKSHMQKEFHERHPDLLAKDVTNGNYILNFRNKAKEITCITQMDEQQK
jgi:hypothetical protein